MKYPIALSLTLAAAVTSCKQMPIETEASAQSEDRVAEVVESALNSVGGSLDEQAEEDFVTLEVKQNQFQKILNLLAPIQSAYAAQCYGRAAGQYCDNGVKGIYYDECTVGLGDHVLSGEVALSYSQSDCSLEETGDYVNRTFELERKTPRGSIINISSKEKADYRGLTYGGGSLLTYQGDEDYSLQILGKHKEKTRPNGRKGFNLSIRSIEDLQVERGITRADRKINSGTIEIAHNGLEYLTTLNLKEIQYSADCCHPVSGSIEINQSGNIEGSGTINFLSCGEIELDLEETVRIVKLKTCE